MSSLAPIRFQVVSIILTWFFPPVEAVKEIDSFTSGSANLFSISAKIFIFHFS
jgi:hypothetical protein